MSVLNRKLFAPVRMHAGGSPPHATWDESTQTGHKHSFDSELSDDQVINTQKNLATDEGAFTQALQDAEYFSKQMYPEKTKAEY